jgi:archaemetzincin
MTLKKRPAIGVEVAPVGESTLLAAKTIAAHVEGFLGLPSALLPGLPPPEFALDPGRLQYDAGRLIEGYEAWDPGACGKRVCVLAVDLFVPIFSHVLGEARLGGKVALVSLNRLGPAVDGRIARADQILLRAVKVAFHELGHLFALTHCADPGCLMHFAGDARGLDGIPMRFCRYCGRFLTEAARPGPQAVPDGRV